MTFLFPLLTLKRSASALDVVVCSWQREMIRPLFRSCAPDAVLIDLCNRYRGARERRKDVPALILTAGAKDGRRPDRAEARNAQEEAIHRSLAPVLRSCSSYPNARPINQDRVAVAPSSRFRFASFVSRTLASPRSTSIFICAFLYRAPLPLLHLIIRNVSRFTRRA